MKLLIFSDIHGDKAALERLMDTEADYYFAAGDLSNFARGLDKLGPVLARRRERMFVIPGNHESEKDVADFCESFGFENLHAKSIQLGKYWLAALGYSNITPFQTPGEYTEEEIARRLSPFDSVADPLVLICHCPPKGTRLDCAGPGRHFGSTAVREFIDRRQPVYFYCGHVHEAAGEADRIGRTQGWNVGKTGVVLEI
ncbi:MAG TPA: metallophosphoesterase [Bryobacteraceae bacterium]|nr:metallophosphoesterase [Bryobacteraceae bacterium]